MDDANCRCHQPAPLLSSVERCLASHFAPRLGRLVSSSSPPLFVAAAVMGLESDSGSNPTWIILSVVGLMLAGLGGFIYYADQQRKALKGDQPQDAVSQATNPSNTDAVSSPTLPLDSLFHACLTLRCCLPCSSLARVSPSPRSSVRRSWPRKSARIVHSSQVSQQLTANSQPSPAPPLISSSLITGVVGVC